MFGVPAEGPRFNWVASPHFNTIPNRVIAALVIHTAECGELAAADTNVAGWFANPTSKVSAHYVVGPHEVTQCVVDDAVAWHAGSVNDWTIGIELCGSASQNEAQWDDEYSRAVLSRAAYLCSFLCARYGIPTERVPVSAIMSRTPGIFGHADAVKASGHGTHYDPGPHFKWDEFLDAVRAA